MSQISKRTASGMRRRSLAIATALLFTVIATQAARADLVLAPMSAVVNSGGTANGDISDTFDQSGLSIGYTSGVTNFDAYIASNPMHSNALNTEWISSEGVTTATVTYDFGSSFTINRLALWNEESTGIESLDVFSSPDSSTFTEIASNLSPTNNPVGSPYPADVFSFAATSLRYIRFVMTGPQSGSTFDGIGIGEVAFSQVASTGIPEPSSLAMLSLAVAGFGIGAYRRKRGKSAIDDVTLSR